MDLQWQDWDIHKATKFGTLEQVQLLLRAGCAVNSTSVDGRSPLYNASIRSNLMMARVLLAAGADPNQVVHQSQNPTTPLLTALWWRHEEIARCLLEAGALVNCIQGVSTSPLTRAINANCSPELIERLLELGARENTETEDTAIISALRTGDPDTVRLLLKYKYSLFGVRERGKIALTPLEIVLKSSSSNLTTLFKILIDAGVEIPCKIDWCKLLRKSRYIINRNVVELIKTLLQLGAVNVVRDWFEEMVVEKIWRKFYAASRVIRYEADLHSVVQIILLLAVTEGDIKDALRMLNSVGLKYNLVNSISATHLELPVDLDSRIAQFYRDNLACFPSLLHCCVRAIRRTLGEGKVTESHIKSLKLPDSLLKLLTLPELDNIRDMRFPFMEDTIYLVSGISNG